MNAPAGGLYLVADDLTGALDSAVPFCGAYGPIPVYLGAPHPDGAPHAVVDLATRDGSAPQASQATTRVRSRLLAADLAFKKIDSRLRGHWAGELTELLRGGEFGGCVFAPAFPGQGRTTRDGRQWVQAGDGPARAEQVDPALALRALGLRVGHAALGAATAGVAMLARADVVVFDAGTDHDLAAIVAAVRHAPPARPVLWCGAGGLARALAGHGAPPAPPLQRPTLAIIGTDHVVTRAQVERAAACGVTCHRLLQAQDAGTVDRVREAFARDGDCVLTFGFSADTAPATAAAGIAGTLRDLLPRLPRPRSLVVAGGQTLLSVCRAIGATHLEVDAEVEPGVPRSRLRGGHWDGVAVVSKSGGFGAAGWLRDLMAAALPAPR